MIKTGNAAKRSANKTLLKKSLKKSVIGLLAFTTLILTSQAFASEVQLPRVSVHISGKMAEEAVLEALKIENIPVIIEKFRPAQSGFDWIPHPIETRNEVSTIHFSFRRIKPHHEESENSGGGIWGYFKGKVSNTVSAVTGAATSLFARGEFFGDVTRSELSSVRNVHGFRLDIDLNRSSLVITSMVTHFSIEITLENLGTVEAPVIHVILNSVLDPGMMFPGMDDPQVAAFVATQVTAWAEAIREVTLAQQERLK